MVEVKAHTKMVVVGADVVDGNTIVVDFADGNTHEYKVAQLLALLPSAKAVNNGWRTVAR